MKLEPHRCDLCYARLFTPESSLHKLELDRETDGVLDWELCYKCYDKFLAWIKKTQQESEEEEG